MFIGSGRRMFRCRVPLAANLVAQSIFRRAHRAEVSLWRASKQGGPKQLGSQVLYYVLWSKPCKIRTRVVLILKRRCGPPLWYPVVYIKFVDQCGTRRSPSMDRLADQSDTSPLPPVHDTVFEDLRNSSCIRQATRGAVHRDVHSHGLRQVR